MSCLQETATNLSFVRGISPAGKHSLDNDKGQSFIPPRPFWLYFHMWQFVENKSDSLEFHPLELDMDQEIPSLIGVLYKYGCIYSSLYEFIP